MNEIVNQIVQKTGIPADKAEQALQVVAGFIKQKFPQFGGQIDSALGIGGEGEQKGNDSNPLGDLGKKFGF